ncbi:MAG TPA: GTP cyclohydrolase II RibA [Hyphomicrobiales bacterium]|nr:GTP cyclohydrolase II RibA [Hyphomicrobiales bacterium]
MGTNPRSELLGNVRQILVERALGEFRAGRPIAIDCGTALTLALPAESLTGTLLPLFQEETGRVRLVMSAKAGEAKGGKTAATAIELENLSLRLVEELLMSRQETAQAGLPMPSRGELAGLALAKLALLLPAVIAAEVSADTMAALPLLEVNAEDIFAFRDRNLNALDIVTRASVPLEGTGDCEFVVFRGGDGFRDQIAVIVGNPSPERPVLTRIHSACLTGDLFGSLRCDCGEQLRGSVQAMGENGGGVLLYLDQEGRGNGIANKLRAYRLQDQGFDTYDADELLGFGQDQRRYGFAAAMLKKLGYTSIRLMTNNPHKIAALKEAGLAVVSTHRVLTTPTAHNAKYLAAKRDKAGHLLGEVALDGAEAENLLLRAARHDVNGRGKSRQ